MSEIAGHHPQVGRRPLLVVRRGFRSTFLNQYDANKGSDRDAMIAQHQRSGPYGRVLSAALF